MSKKERESFKEYAQRWREVSSRVQPPLVERELNDLCMGTFPSQYYERLLGSNFSDFSNLVMVGEKIAEGLKMVRYQEEVSDRLLQRNHSMVLRRKRLRPTLSMNQRVEG